MLELTLCGGRGARIECYKDGPAYNAKLCDALPNQDYYDVSNVDGVSRIWGSMEIIRGRRLVGKGAPADNFNCGKASMPGAFDMSMCPQPMRIRRNDSDPHGYTANEEAVADTVGCLSACNFMSQVALSAPGQPKSGWLADRREAQAHSSVHTQPPMSPVTAADVAQTCCECGHGADRGVCPAPLVSPETGKVCCGAPTPGAGAKCADARRRGSQTPPCALVGCALQITWPAPNAACIAGCSPYANYPSSYNESMCTLDRMPSIRSSSGGDKIRLGEVQAIFKHWAPGAYSWQFDDLSSTYLCESADYLLTFCPRS